MDDNYLKNFSIILFTVILGSGFTLSSLILTSGVSFLMFQTAVSFSRSADIQTFLLLTVSLSVCFSPHYWHWPCQELSTCIILLVRLDSLKLMGLVKKVNLLLFKCLLFEVVLLESRWEKSGRNSDWTIIFIKCHTKRNSKIFLLTQPWCVINPRWFYTGSKQGFPNISFSSKDGGLSRIKLVSANFTRSFLKSRMKYLN